MKKQLINLEPIKEQIKAKLIEKYNTSKEELEKYNNIIDINIGDKLIIPANDK